MAGADEPCPYLTALYFGEFETFYGEGTMVARRGFLERLGAAALALAGAPAVVEGTTRRSPGQGSPDAWIDGLTGKHKQFFDIPLHNNGVPLLLAYNFHNTFARAYGTKPGEVNAVISCYGAPGLPASIMMGWNDAMWDKYRVSELIGLKDASGGHLTRNVFSDPRAGDPVLMNGAAAHASLKNLMAMGSTVLMCNNSLIGWCRYMEGQGRGKAAEIEADIRANLIPGIILVPAMVIAINKGQAAGLTYIRV